MSYRDLRVGDKIQVKEYHSGHLSIKTDYTIKSITKGDLEDGTDDNICIKEYVVNPYQTYKAYRFHPPKSIIKKPQHISVLINEFLQDL